MPVRRDIPYNQGLFFITFTCYKWMALIEEQRAMTWYITGLTTLKNKTTA
jgi:hypothetical protein